MWVEISYKDIHGKVRTSSDQNLDSAYFRLLQKDFNKTIELIKLIKNVYMNGNYPASVFRKNNFTAERAYKIHFSVVNVWEPNG